jgi:hypothetical protein
VLDVEPVAAGVLVTVVVDDVVDGVVDGVVDALDDGTVPVGVDVPDPLECGPRTKTMMAVKRITALVASTAVTSSRRGRGAW